LALFAIAALSGASALFFGHVAMLLPAATVLVLALNRFLLPSHYRLDREAIHAQYPLRRQSLHWKHVLRVGRDAHGLWLSRRARPSRLDAFRGMQVLFGTERAEVEARVVACLREAGVCGAS